MTRPIIHDGGIDREMTQAEHEQWLELVAEIEAQTAAINALEATRTSAHAKLKELGLTDDEIAALVG